MNDDVNALALAGDPLAGRCGAFCPPSEAAERRHNRFLSPCEVAPGRQLVKRYSRSAAGVTFDEHTLRPLPVLQRVVAYLLGDVLPSVGVSFEARYGFVSDRLRAVRQDAAVQQLCSVALLRLLVASARFHVLAWRVAAAAAAPEAGPAAGAGPGGHTRLGGSGDEGDRLDPVMNDSRLLECVAHGLGVCEQLLALDGGDDGGGGGDRAEVLRCHAELLAYRLGAAFLEPGGVLAALRTLARTRPAQLRAWPVAAVLRVYAAWQARDWRGALGQLDALGGGQAERADASIEGGLAPLLWGLLQRYVPLARLLLVRSLAHALPPRAGGVPIDAVVRLLLYRPGASPVAAAADGGGGGGDFAWEGAARFCLQLRQAVLLLQPAAAAAAIPVAGSAAAANSRECAAPPSKEGVPVGAQLLGELHRASAACGEPAAPPLVVHFDRAADLEPRSTDPRVRAALGPTLEAPPGHLRFPASAAALSALVMHGLLAAPDAAAPPWQGDA